MCLQVWVWHCRGEDANVFASSSQPIRVDETAPDTSPPNACHWGGEARWEGGKDAAASRAALRFVLSGLCEREEGNFKQEKQNEQSWGWGTRKDGFKSGDWGIG